jgi:hypothetical protein
MELSDGVPHPDEEEDKTLFIPRLPNFVNERSLEQAFAKWNPTKGICPLKP